jgi:hypothetical protein
MQGRTAFGPGASAARPYVTRKIFAAREGFFLLVTRHLSLVTPGRFGCGPRATLGQAA